MNVRTYGKLNLTLAVTGRRGLLHTLESVMTTVSVFDEVTAERADAVSVECAGIPAETNAAYKAAKLVERVSGLRLRISIRKGIPVGGGMGGSSADAAAVAVVAQRLLAAEGKSLDVGALSALLGSDVAFMTRGGVCMVRGTGDEIAPLPSKTDFTALLIDCGSVSTPACYAAFDETGGASGRDSRALVGALSDGAPLSDDMLFNDLTGAARRLQPRIAGAERLLRARGVEAHLTGSGGCLFALTEDGSLADALAAEGFACRFVRTVPTGVELL